MDRRSKLILIALAAGLMLSACTPDTPETEFGWGVNDRSARADNYDRSAPPPAVPTTRTARTYVYEGDNYAVPAPKPRPEYQPPRPEYQPAYQPHYDDHAPMSRVAFAWPASGRVISGFGATAIGERNDGINIAWPMGAPIKAAASGTVSYSGNGLKDYGNLLLIKHPDGYVTAYAHADQLLVQQGQAVTKGQVIGYAGRTGDVSTPQLHFEIRHDTTPLNPSSLLASRSS